jgi:hypothetical protein
MRDLLINLLRPARTYSGDKWFFDSRIANSESLSWDEICEFFVKIPLVEQDKNQLTRFNFGHYTQPHALKANLRAYDALVIDYDHGVAIDDVKNKYAHVTHCGYTTYNHGKDGTDRFRLIVPLKSPISVDHYRTRNTAFQRFFEWADATTFDLNRSFFVPSMTAANHGKAQTWINNGGWFDWEALEVETEIAIQKPVHIPRAHSGHKGVGGCDILRLFRDHGWLLGKDGSNRFRVKCPEGSSHGNGEYDAFIHLQPGSDFEWGFNCFHNHGGAPHRTKWFLDWFQITYGRTALLKYCDMPQPSEAMAYRRNINNFVGGQQKKTQGEK